MSDANGSAGKGSVGARSSTSPEPARPDVASEQDEQATVAVGATPSPRPLTPPTPAWPPVSTAGGGYGSGGSAGNKPAQQHSSPLDRVTAAAKPDARSVPEQRSTPQGPNSHAALHVPASAPREKFQFSEAVNRAREAVASAAGRGPRRARLQLKKIDPWSMMKFSFAVAFVLFVMGVVASAILYTVLDAVGVFDSLNETIRSLTTSDDQSAGSSAFEIDAKLVIGGSALLGAVNMVLFTAMSTLGAFIYNVCADLAGGIELTLAERE